MCPRFLHAVAGSVHPLGDLVGADPLGVAPNVRHFGAPRSSGLGRCHGDQGRSVPMGTAVPLGAELKNNGNAIFVTAQVPNRNGKFTAYVPSECPALKKERRSENPWSLRLQ